MTTTRATRPAVPYRRSAPIPPGTGRDINVRFRVIHAQALERLRKRTWVERMRHGRHFLMSGKYNTALQGKALQLRAVCLGREPSSVGSIF